MTDLSMDHLATATATVNVLKAATSVIQAFPKAEALLVWGNPPTTIEDGARVSHPELVGRPTVVYGKGDDKLWSDHADMGHGELPDVDGLHELLRDANQALPWIVKVGHGGYWTIQLKMVAAQLAAFTTA